MQQKGFSAIFILIGVFVVTVSIAGGLYLAKPSSKLVTQTLNKPQATPQSAQVSPTPIPPQKIVEMTEHVNNDLGFSIKYPKNWNVKEGFLNKEYRKETEIDQTTYEKKEVNKLVMDNLMSYIDGLSLSQKSYIIHFTPEPEVKGIDIHNPGLYIVVDDTNYLSAAEALENVNKELAKKPHPQLSIVKLIPGRKFIEGTVEVDYHGGGTDPPYAWPTEGSMGSSKGSFMYWVVNKSKIYILNGTSNNLYDEKDVSNYDYELDLMLKSFTFTNL